MKILKYKKMKDNKYEIFLDNGISLKIYDDLIIKYDLLLKKNISDEELKSIEQETDALSSYYKALKYITKKLRCEKEIRNYLSKDYNNSIIDDTIKKLKKDGYLDDNIYIKSFIIDHYNLTSDGPYRIKKLLMDMNFEEDKILLELDNISDDEWSEKLKKIVNKKIKSNHQYGINKLKEKILYDMSNMGYPKWMIEDSFKDMDFNISNSLLEKEFNKWYIKYSKKYDENQLYYFLKNKIISKGFSSSEFENIWREKM